MIEALHDPEARIEILTGNDWAAWYKEHLKAATSSVLVSVYMLSPYWRGPVNTKLDLIADLAAAAQRGLTCRLIVDQPNVNYRTLPFNVRSALRLQEAGWKVRVMPDNPTLHEKVTVIDEAISVVGSHNISKASAVSNYDTSLAVYSPLLADRLKTQFWRRWRLAETLKATP